MKSRGQKAIALNQTIAVGTLLSDIQVEQSEYASYILPIGSTVSIARIIRTPAGLSFRLKNTVTWVPENQIKAEFQSCQVFDYTGTHPEEAEPESWKNNKLHKVSKQKNKSGINSNNQLKRRIRYVTNNHTPILGVLTGASRMKKQDLKVVLQSLNAGDVVKVTFRGAKAEKSGEFTVIQTRTGRGKGGSRLVELKTASGELVVTGTPESDEILHFVTPDGVLHGFESEAEVPPMFETDSAGASELKKTFAGLVDAEGQYTVDMTSTHEAFNGRFTVLRGIQKRGRYGQVVLTLQAAGGEPFELWSFRHSGVITSFTVLADESQAE